MKVLVVDDAGFSRLITQKVLEKLHNTVITSSSANEALRILRNDPDIDVVISDLNMPEVNGLQLIAEAQNMVRYSDKGIIQCPPFILLTAVTDPFILQKANLAGYSYILSKPADSNQLFSALELSIKNASQKTVQSSTDTII